MSNYRFTVAEKYAVYKVHGPNCRWCNEPVRYRHCQIDHIIPEVVPGGQAQLNELIALYGLTENFGINTFYNWIPIHPDCNQSKSNDVFRGAPFIGQLLQRIGEQFDETKAIHDNWKKEPKAAKVLARLEQAIVDGIVSEDEIGEIILAARPIQNPYIGLTASAIQNHIFILPQQDGWTVVRSLDGYDEVTKDGRFGYAPNADSPDISWFCGTCHHYGPWDGNRCQTCGTMSFPD